jgi:hypothetical protein
MDESRFDALARTLSIGSSRRRALVFLSGGLLGSLTLDRPDDTAAKKKKRKKKKKKKGPGGTGPSPAPPPAGPVNPCDVTILPGEDLQEVISNADTSSRRFTICLLGGTYDLFGAAPSPEDLLINGNFALLGAGQGQTILQGSGRLGRTVVGARGDVRLSDLTITGGNGSSGGGLFNGFDLTMTNCTITGNAAAHGGGIFSGGSEDFSNVTLIGCTISGNSAFTGNKIGSGGGIWNLANVSMTDTTISDNQADIAGAIFNDTDGTVTFGTGNTISGNTSTEGGSDCVGVTC